MLNLLAEGTTMSVTTSQEGSYTLGLWQIIPIWIAGVSNVMAVI